MVHILPRPKQMEEKEGKFLCDFGMRIVSVSEDLLPQKGWALPSVLKEYLSRWAGIRAELGSGKVYKGDVSLALNNELKGKQYKLHITTENILIEGGDREAVGYGISTLCQLVKTEGSKLPALKITDEPDVPVRGYYLDQARGRICKLSTLKKFIDDLSLYKINQFQFYIEQSFLFRGFSEMWREDTVLTADEILELDKYCRERDIDLVPSLASFGHLYELLKTKSYEDICELNDSAGKQFSFVDKQQHHTVAVAHKKSFAVVQEMLDQFLPLFTSKLVNICADETFDIGRERSKHLADEVGKDRLYTDFLKKLCTYVDERGKIPMFWGDVICKSPELIKELPPETICMAWGYLPDQKDDICEPIARVGANLYLCPGVSTWNTYVATIDIAYANNKIMSRYAKTYKAIGILNTDWGDFGHVNDPEFSVPGLIYGAVFSWNFDDGIEKDELNRMISRLHYTDRTGELLNYLSKASKEHYFDWWMAVGYAEDFAVEGRYEKEKQPMEYNVHKEVLRRIENFKANADKLAGAEEILQAVRFSIRDSFDTMDSSMKDRLNVMNNAIWAVSIWNRVGKAIFIEGSLTEEEKRDLASELEVWFTMYKDIYRTSSKEGMLHRVERVIYWYADTLRGMKNSPWAYK